jgi:hypothetical protein
LEEPLPDPICAFFVLIPAINHAVKLSFWAVNVAINGFSRTEPGREIEHQMWKSPGLAEADQNSVTAIMLLNIRRNPLPVKGV